MKLAAPWRRVLILGIVDATIWKDLFTETITGLGSHGLHDVVTTILAAIGNNEFLDVVRGDEVLVVAVRDALEV